MIRSALFVAILGVVVAVPASYLSTGPARQGYSVPVQRGLDNVGFNPELSTEGWPICSSMGTLAESADWATLDPDFAAGKRAIVAGDLNGAIEVLTSAALRDDRNADIQNYLGYAYRRLRQLDEAMQHYRLALTLNPRHRSAHEHLGEAYLVQGDLAKAEQQLAALERICLIPCEEQDDLKRAIAGFNRSARQ